MDAQGGMPVRFGKTVAYGSLWFILVTGPSAACPACPGTGEGDPPDSGRPGDGGSSADGAVSSDAGDHVSPYVISTSPPDGAEGVGVSASIVAQFSEDMDPLSVTSATFTVQQGGTATGGTVSCTGAVAVFQPTEPLALSRQYRATVSLGVKDRAGNYLESQFAWTFTTADDTDVTPPTVTASAPVNGAVNVWTLGSISATFSKLMDPESITAATFTLERGSTPVPGHVSLEGLTATLDPDQSLAYSTEYVARLRLGVRDASGLPMADEYLWRFYTGAEQIPELPVNLGAAGTFAILAKSGVSTVPASAITGDVGVSPAAATFITGFSLTLDSSSQFSGSSQVVGRIFAADYAPPTPANMTTTINDMELGFTDASGRPAGVTELGAGSIGGLNLAAGVYKWGTSVLVASDLTLSGTDSDVWVFQIAQDLTIANGVRVTLAGGADAKNVFWQVTGQVVLGTSSHIEGVVLCATSVTLKTGASARGRLLAQTSVDMDHGVVVEPEP